ncbi:type II toxin-antitoxin system HicB family antitoxin [Peribacillus frigoritolerans]|uniref:type II toxin-antitoxin system HicB family antitoxin n=1 Tax=Peribacillus frigoritolerans TaxID=450367 RepID=UPI001EF09947|nr:type II toxin-antitoxin system HicB family antitoxin [Peribacillus frigoritolerans]
MVSFPDLENCYTDGRTLVEAVAMAEDVLGTMLSYHEDERTAIPAPSKADDLKATVLEGVSLVLITINTDNFREG